MGNNYIYHSHRHAPGLFWPIVLIGAGVILLLSNMGLLAVDAWSMLWRLWPVLLVVIGLDVLFGRRGVWGSIISALLGLLVIAGVIALLFAAQNNPALFGMQTAPIIFNTDLQQRNEHIAYPLDQVRSANVQIDFHGGNASVYALGDSPNLLEGDVTYRGNLVNSITRSSDRAQVRLQNSFPGLNWSIFNDAVPANWKLGLNPGTEYDLNFNTGSGSYQMDLTKLNLRSLSIDGGSGSMTVDLPSGGKYNFDLHIGSGSATIRVPEGVAARVQYHVDSGSVSASNLREVSRNPHDGVYESATYAQGGPYVSMTVDIGSGSIDIH